MKKIGIYSIINIVDGKRNIGSSRNIDARLYNHLSCLCRNKHRNAHLQNAFNKNGKLNFIFNIIELTELATLFVREQYWIDYFKSSNRRFGYNIIQNVVENILSEETKIKISQTVKKQYADGRKNNFKGKHHTEETKKIIGMKSKQKPLTEEYKSRLLLANKKSNIVCNKPVLQFSLDDVFVAEHISINAAVKFLFPEMSNNEITKTRKGVLISRCCNKKGKTAFGYKFKFKEIL